MIAIRQHPLLILLLFISGTLFGQKDPRLKPDRSRELFHGYVDREQIVALRSDGKDDKLFTVSPNEEVNFLVTNALIKKVDQLQYKIEKDSILGGQHKIRYIRGLERLLRDLNLNWKAKRFSAASLPAILDGFAVCLEKDRNGTSIEQYIDAQHYYIAKPLVNSTAFDNNPGIKNSRDIIFRKYCELFPEQILYSLSKNSNFSFTDSLIKVAAYKYPKQLYNYAAANNKLGMIIRKIDDPLIRTVSQMASRTKSGQWYFPFLDNILKGKITMADIDAVRDDEIKYYKLLVRTHIDYVERAIGKDTAIEFASLTERLEGKARSIFVNEINALHNESAAVRFRIIQPLTAQELYYLAVSSDGIIYTSSFVKGVYPLMMSKAPGQRGDSLLMLVKFDKYRKMIKMAAGYNTLSHFLGSFTDKTNAESLMRAFVSRLEQTGGLEDGVDVADSYASIVGTIKPLANEMLLNVKHNYERNFANNNKRGIVMYNLLQKLFLSADTSNRIDLTKELGIPPVYNVDYKFLATEEGRVIMQVFFYGDKDGKNIFPGFLGLFSNSNWSIDRSNPLWVKISSIKGKPVLIFANRPLPEETGEDDKAQTALGEYLEKNKLYPTITIHRGHSYYAQSTIGHMFSTSKIVFLGSCGGYHLIHAVLEKAPDAHIISTKQIGDAPVNQPFFRLLTEKIRNGNSIDWIPFWRELDNMVTSEIFEDYIPPYKNLGAIFIKGYKIAMGEGEVVAETVGSE